MIPFFVISFWSHHSKNVVLGLKKPFLGPFFRREEVFRGLKQGFVSDKTQIFLG